MAGRCASVPTTATYPLPVTDPKDSAAIVHGLREEGYAFLPGLLSRERATQVCRMIDVLTSREGDRRNDGGRGIDHYQCVFDGDPARLELIDPPGIIDAVEACSGPAATSSAERLAHASPRRQRSGRCRGRAPSAPGSDLHSRR